MLQLLEDTRVEAIEMFDLDGESAEAADDHFTKARLAELSPTSISRMSSDDMARAIRDVSVLQFCDEKRLDYLDRPMLERLVYLARQCCRNQGY